MRVCFISSEAFIGRRGGFGKLVKAISRELTKRGFDVWVITWRDPGMAEYMEVEGVKILSYPYTYTSHSAVRHLADYSRVIPLIRRVNADIYISIDCMIETYIAMKVASRAKHVIWVQDPFDEVDFELLSSVDPYYRFRKPEFEATRALYTLAYRRADLVMTQARYYIPKIAKLYRVDPGKVVYIPNPVEHIPDEVSITKAEDPTVCYLGRMDPQKRYWLFFELARSFPEIRFIAMGVPNELYRNLYEKIAERYRGLKNLEVKGFVSEEEKSKTLSKCWISCLPSVREGLPIAFLEALAHKTALLSTVNPDGYVSAFGYYAREIDELARGLQHLFKDGLWMRKGELGRNYVVGHHSLNEVVSSLEKHLEELKL